jgi:excisionase family DNA binding protein
MADPSLPLALSIADVGKLAGIGRTRLYGEISAGRLRIVKVGRRSLILADDLRRWLNGLPSVSGAGDGKAA